MKKKEFNKKTKKIKKKFPNFNLTKAKYPNRLYVNEINKVWWNTGKTHELSEKAFGKALKEFFPDEEIIIRKKLKNSKYWSISPDFLINLKDATAFDSETKKEKEIKGIIFEYDGEKHFNSAQHMHSDKIKMQEIYRLEYRRIRIPFYFQLTKDLSKFIFNGLMYHFTGKTFWKEERWKNAVKKIYRNPFNGQQINDKDFEEIPLILSPGMHATEYYPKAFIDEGLERFIKDFNWKSKRPYKNLYNHPDATFPESAKHQIIKALELYINDTNSGKGGEPDELILPSKKSAYGKKLNEIYHNILNEINEDFLKEVFFCRKKYDDFYSELQVPSISSK